MRLDLSSHITLERIPKKYYRPENDFEKYNLSRFEKLPVVPFEETGKAARKIANDIVKEMKKKEGGKPFVLGISGGTSPVPIYEELVRLHKQEGVSFKNVVVFNTYEFYPVLDFSISNLQTLKDQFMSQVDIDPKNIYSPDATIEKDLIAENCEIFEQTLSGRAHHVLGLGTKGNGL